MKSLALFPLMLLPLAAQPSFKPPEDATPKDVRNFLIDVADDLTNKNSAGFLSRFDPKMPGYETLHYEIEGLLGRPDVTCNMEIVTDKGDNQQRALELDWVLYVETDRPRRQNVKIRIEKQGKKWKIVALDPVDFFKPTAVP